MALKVHNYLKHDHPYYNSKTRRQWRKEGRGILDGAKGTEMWTNQYCGDTAVYYKLDETYPATEEEIAAWKQQDREARKERKRERHEEWLAFVEAERRAEEREREKERERQAAIAARIQRYAEFEPGDIICLDVETTGLSSDDEILQLSIMDGRGEVLFNEYIKPIRVSEWPEAQNINRISPEMVADKPTIEAHIPRINEILSKAKLIIGYSLDFDTDFIRRVGVDIPQGIRYFDVMLWFAKIYGEWSEYHQDYRWQPLSFCAEYYGYQNAGSYHDSLEDVRATLYCFRAMIASPGNR